jgi:cytidylate kinase
VPPLAESRNPVQAHEAETRKAIRELARTGAVILGRGAAIVLKDEPGALHVRLDGPLEARVSRAVATRALDEATARQRLESSDRARTAYVRHFYRSDAADPRHYHLVLQATAFSIDACVDLVVAAARARVQGDGGPPQP